METLKLYGTCVRQDSLSLVQKADYSVHVFDGVSGKFFFKNTNEMTSFTDMKQIILKEYVSDARKLLAKGIIKTFRLRSFMKEKDIEVVTKGLIKIIEHINEISPKFSPEFRSDAHKIIFLRRAVGEYQSWSVIVIQNITSQKFSFNCFVKALHEAIKNLRQLQLIR